MGVAMMVVISACTDVLQRCRSLANFAAKAAQRWDKAAA